MVNSKCHCTAMRGWYLQKDEGERPVGRREDRVRSPVWDCGKGSLVHRIPYHFLWVRWVLIIHDMP